jgi:signal transduction histidine kinase
MTIRPAAVAGWSFAAIAVVVWAFALWIVYHGPPGTPAIPPDGLVWAAPFLALVVVGGLIGTEKPRNTIGWLLIAAGLLQGVGLLASGVLRYAYASGGHEIVGWLDLAPAAIGSAAYLALALVLLTFPDGSLLSRRWRWVEWLAIVFAVLNTVDAAVSPVPPLPGGLPVSLLADAGLARVLDAMTSSPVTGVFFLLSAGSLPFRYRVGSPAVKQQIKWFAFGVTVLVVGLVANGVGGAAVGPVNPGSIWSFVGTTTQTVALLGVPVAIGIAILRHRLFDIDLIISRTLTYGALAGLATALYVALVIGIGSLVGRTAGTNLFLSIVATAFVAIAFQPLRQRLHESANRLVYGRHQPPYESLAGFTRQLAHGYGIRDALPQMVEALADGLRCRAAAVMLSDGRVMAPAAHWSVSSPLPDVPPDYTVEVVHQGELLGSLAVWSLAGEKLSANEVRLLADLAVQAGLVLHNARLSAELERRLAELQASRLRLVSAQDQERRRIERDLHDGAQHDLVALRMKLGLAEGVARNTSSELATVLAELRDDTAATLENIRRLSRGLYPPLLESQGLAAALSAHARRLSIPVQVHACDTRFAYNIETAVYFCCVEALHNAAKHSCAARVWVSIQEANHNLHFEIGDDGRGFDPARTNAGSGIQNIRDRVDALEGTLRIVSGSAGTCITGSIPAAHGRQIPEST